MKHQLLTLIISLLLCMVAMPSLAQVVSDNNEDRVNKIDQRMAQFDEFVPGQVLVKFKDSSPVTVRKAKGRFQSASRNNVDAVLQAFGVDTMEKLLPNEKAGRTLRKAKAFNGKTIEESDLSQLYMVQMENLRPDSTQMLAEQLGKLDEVEYAEPNYKVYLMANDVICENASSNPQYSQQWGISSVGLDQLWQKPVVNSKRPVIAILDTGVDITHPDLVDNIWTNTAESEGESGYDNDNNGFKSDVHGWDFINNTADIHDWNMHGTHVAGIAAASNNELGIVGANPQALIMPITVMQSDGTGDVATIIKGINYAVANGATVINLSLGTYSNSSAFRQALANAYGQCVIVAAAGNDGLGIYPECGSSTYKPMFPAAYSFVLGVQATTSSYSENCGYRASFSNFDCDGPTFSHGHDAYGDEGVNYELSAPGAGILSTVPGGNYKSLNGTSMAAPLVAGGISALQMVKEYESQEVLWGDLIHAENSHGEVDFNAAYNITEHPAELELISINYDDSQDGGNSDQAFDAGETMRLYPVIKTTWGEAKNIKMNIRVADGDDASLVEVLNDADVDFGWNLSSYSKQTSVNPLIIKTANSTADNRHIRMLLTATCDNVSQEIAYEFPIVVSNVTKLSGLIDKNTTLTADKVYYVNDDIAIVSGSTLTIEPGTILEFASGKSISVANGAKLIADGLPGKLITFRGRNGASWNGILSTTKTSSFWTNEDKTKLSYYYSEDTPIRYKEAYLYGPCARYFGTPNSLLHESINLLSVNRDDLHGTAVQLSKLFQYNDTLSYSNISNITGKLPFVNNSIIDGNIDPQQKIIGEKCNMSGILYTTTTTNYLTNYISSTYSNFVNMKYSRSANMQITEIMLNNYFNINEKIYLTPTMGNTQEPRTVPLVFPSYFGTGKEEVLRPHIFEMGNGSGIFVTSDLSNMRTEPIAEAHGIVWKVVVNGYDTQDEYEQLPPLGVGRHKFEVYFNRPMNTAVAPNISFGVREPYTQHVVAEDGSWSADGKIYTAYYTITGKTSSDGVNRIYVYGAEDDEYFEIPYEKTRFNINIQAAGSMATGFSAEAGLGKVTLNWNNSENNFDDAMGFNVYRYNFVEKDSLDSRGRVTGVKIMVPDTVRINQNILDIEATSYIDYKVTPGETYYYFYKVLSTDLREYDVSNTVTVTPLTSSLGDANGSGDVDVADVITTVNYAAGQDPKPFIYEAADMNTDNNIDILDVIGIIKVILNPGDVTGASVEATATYTVEDGIVYVESPVDLAGVQVQLATEEKQEIIVSDDMKGFENTSAWLSDNDYIFLGYNMNGKTLPAGKNAILNIGNAKIGSIKLSDKYGHNILAVSATPTGIDRMGSDVKNVTGIYTLSGVKVSGNAKDLKKLPGGVYIVDGEKVVK